MSTLVEVKSISKTFSSEGLFAFKESKAVKALSNISFEVKKGETLGLVGESGSGKTTLSRIILRLIEPSEGRIIFDGSDITQMQGSELRKFRRRMQMVFQDPFGSLNPKMKIGKALEEPLIIHGIGENQKQRMSKVLELLQSVGLNEGAISKFPHEFSGGQRQRIGIARALAVDPEFLICDEPVSALDVSVQIQILNLLRDLQKAKGLTILFISHDLKVISYMCHRVVVLKNGQVIEVSNTPELLSNPKSEYSRTLIAASPNL